MSPQHLKLIGPVRRRANCPGNYWPPEIRADDRLVVQSNHVAERLDQSKFIYLKHGTVAGRLEKLLRERLHLREYFHLPFVAVAAVKS